MDMTRKNNAASLGVRIGIVFFSTVVVVALIAYFVLFNNFQVIIANNTGQLVDNLLEQGVEIVESHLDLDRQEVAYLADAFEISDNGEVVFPEISLDDGYIRMRYVTRENSVSSDGAQQDVRDRQDVVEAFTGEVALYGPFFNDEPEFVVCYSAPIKENNEIIGVLSIEKDGYIFSDLIENIQPSATGRSYIIDASGTDIAVGDRENVEWITSRYNAKRLYEENPTEESKSIMLLEEKGLNGQAGTDTYYWQGNLCRVSYQPIPSTGWVLLTSVRENELNAMTHSSMFASISKSRMLWLCFVLVLLLTALIIYWIVSSMRKDAELNEKLNNLANYDILTGLMNRNSYHAYLDMVTSTKKNFYALIYIDLNGLHELNNHLGHQAGDIMLKAVADALYTAFPQDDVYRIGGDEFVVICQKESKKPLEDMMGQVQASLQGDNYYISVGIAYYKANCNIDDIVAEAETKMQSDKRHFYQEKGNSRRLRVLDEQLEQMIAEKQDADAFLSFLAPEFKGVYFVNLNRDTTRHIYIPAYFEANLKEANNRFSAAILIYARKFVMPEYYCSFEKLCDYEDLQKMLDEGDTPELIYQKIDGEWLKLRVLKFRDYKETQRETLWTFVKIDSPMEK